VQTTKLLARFAGSLPEIRSMGLMQFDPVWALREHTTPACELMHLVAGTMDLVTRSGRLPAGPGDTLLVPTETPHRDAFDLDKNIEIFYISFTWPSEADYFRQMRPETTLQLSAQRKAEISALFDQLRTDITGPTPLDKLVARSRVLTILLLFLRDALAERRTPGGTAEGASPSSRRHQALAARAKAYLQKNLSSAITLEKLASHLHVSSYHLSHVFSQESNFSLFAFLTTIRMEKAKALLREGKLNVSQVAYAVGYHDPNYFSKAFRKRCGCSPSDFAAHGGASLPRTQ